MSFFPGKNLLEITLGYGLNSREGEVGAAINPLCFFAAPSTDSEDHPSSFFVRPKIPARCL